MSGLQLVLIESEHLEDILTLYIMKVLQVLRGAKTHKLFKHTNTQRTTELSRTRTKRLHSKLQEQQNRSATIQCYLYYK